MPVTNDISALAIRDGTRRDHRGDVCGIVLEIAVHRDDVAAASVVEPGGEGRRLAEVAPEADHAQPGIHRLEPRQNVKALVRAAVVDHHDFECAAPPGQRLHELANELRDGGRLVAYRNDDTQVDHERPILSGFYRAFARTALLDAR